MESTKHCLTRRVYWISIVPIEKQPFLNGTSKTTTRAFSRHKFLHFAILILLLLLFWLLISIRQTFSSVCLWLNFARNECECSIQANSLCAENANGKERLVMVEWTCLLLAIPTSEQHKLDQIYWYLTLCGGTRGGLDFENWFCC